MAPDRSVLYIIGKRHNTNSMPSGSIHIWKEDEGKKWELSKR